MHVFSGQGLEMCSLTRGKDFPDANSAWNTRRSRTELTNSIRNHHAYLW